MLVLVLVLVLMLVLVLVYIRSHLGSISWVAKPIGDTSGPDDGQLRLLRCFGHGISGIHSTCAASGAPSELGIAGGVAAHPRALWRVPAPRIA